MRYTTETADTRKIPRLFCDKDGVMRPFINADLRADPNAVLGAELEAVWGEPVVFKIPVPGRPDHPGEVLWEEVKLHAAQIYAFDSLPVKPATLSTTQDMAYAVMKRAAPDIGKWETFNVERQPVYDETSILWDLEINQDFLDKTGLKFTQEDKHQFLSDLAAELPLVFSKVETLVREGQKTGEDFIIIDDFFGDVDPTDRLYPLKLEAILWSIKGPDKQYVHHKTITPERHIGALWSHFMEAAIYCHQRGAYQVVEAQNAQRTSPSQDMGR